MSTMQQQPGTTNDSRLGSTKSDNSSSETNANFHEISARPHRVFINHLDGYHTSKLIDLLYNETFVPIEFEKESIDDQEYYENEDEEVKKPDEDLPSRATGSSKKEPSIGSSISGSSMRRRYDIIGTVSDQKIKNIEGARIMPPPCSSQEDFMAEVMRCGFIIFDITQDSSQIETALWTLNQILSYLEEYQKAMPKAFAANQDCRYFILVSNVMTWASTRPMGEPLTEAHYRKRKPHKNASKDHIQCERLVFGATKRCPHLSDKLRTAVVCAGITYGAENYLLEYAFKLGYRNEKQLPVILDGDNLVPLLHCRDLAAAIFAIMKEWPRLRYVLAVERVTSTQRDIIKAVSRVLTTGKIKNISKEKARENPDITCKVLNAMTIDQSLQSDFLTRSKFMKWQYELSFVDNVERVVQEFRESRNLHPLRVIILGPPASGKSLIARLLAIRYRLHYVSIKKLIHETIEQLKEEIAEKKIIDERPEEEEEDLDDTDFAQMDNNFEEIIKLENMLDEINNDLSENNGILKDTTLTKIFQFKLLSKPCRNQGYIIDGYPKTMAQATMLFTSDNDNGDEEEDNGGISLNEEDLMAILPDLVIAFDARDEFLMNRVLSLNEKRVANSRYTEENMRTRLASYRERNVEDNSPFQLFDELEIHPIIINVEEDATPQMISTYHCCLGLIGETQDYGKTLEELEEERRRDREIEAAEKAKQADEQARINAEIQCQKHQQEVQWANLLEQLKIEEEQRLKMMAEPLRHFLCKQVLPLITQGLVQVTKMRPEDPVGYLAEYLIKENPEARQFEPDYTEAGSSALSSIKLLQCQGALPPFGAVGDDVFETQSRTTTSKSSSSSDQIRICQCYWPDSVTSSCYFGESGQHMCTGSYPSGDKVNPASTLEPRSGGTTACGSQVQDQPCQAGVLEEVQAVDRDERVDAAAKAEAEAAEVAEPITTQDAGEQVGDVEKIH